MKILRINDFFEKIQVSAISLDDLDDVKVEHQISKQEQQAQKTSTGDWYEDMRGKDIHVSIECIRNLTSTTYDKSYKANEDTENRFDQWTNLSESEMIKKHEQRANKKMTREKYIAAYCWALLYYGPDVTRYNKRSFHKKEIPIIIRRYHNMMLREGWTDEQIMKAIFH